MGLMAHRRSTAFTSTERSLELIRTTGSGSGAVSNALCTGPTAIFCSIAKSGLGGNHQSWPFRLGCHFALSRNRPRNVFPHALYVHAPRAGREDR